MDISVRELADPGSMKLRLSYWRVALSVALDNSFTGVGLGNFRVAYGPYQYLGAGDVQNAHNAVLQAWCEVGLPGALEDNPFKFDPAKAKAILAKAGIKDAHFTLDGSGPSYLERPNLDEWPKVNWAPDSASIRVDATYAYGHEKSNQNSTRPGITPPPAIVPPAFRWRMRRRLPATG
mgnify:CR=1 FL=1